MSKSILFFFSVAIGLTAILMSSACALPVTQNAFVDLTIRLKDNKGQPMKNTEIVLWEYDHGSLRSTTNDEGVATFKTSYSYGKSLVQFWIKRPEVFPIRIRVPKVSELYYRFDVEKDGAVNAHVFNTSYDYFFGEQWIGEFDEKSQVRKTIRDDGTPYEAVSPSNTCQCVALWKNQVKITPDKKRWQIFFDLEPSGTWKLGN